MEPRMNGILSWRELELTVLSGVAGGSLRQLGPCSVPLIVRKRRMDIRTTPPPAPSTDGIQHPDHDEQAGRRQGRYQIPLKIVRIDDEYHPSRAPAAEWS